ncbi:amino acid adenylation domain-containing protein [Flavitalea sp. BT771]|uniref:non-ribosomal peptide synthetase n=1 Tax=Flavitalea sp. BT771 TaxID=3063329 RepID=UPI0026E1E968|nr:amino acid adenylation domain-containing protein [Flavitalea sp. BT771]MDO6434612.1 amino acid adenylation domain-containing protein [Flavitalea sp. BT771]MDV6223512.1 amino acid adenylation domain-containing protein [Flavitalea sp. BT771]
MTTEELIEDIYPLAPLQEGMYYHWLSDPGSDAYHEQISYRIKGRLDIVKLEESYRMLIERHAVLRTFFTRMFGYNILQVVRKTAQPSFLYLDLSGAAGTAVQEYRDNDRSKGFDLHSGSQMRLSILSLGDLTYEFVWSHHHILMDGWCIGLLVKEFFQLYEGLLRGEQLSLPRPYPYSNYIKWLANVDIAATLQYWKNHLSGYRTASTFPRKIVRTGMGYNLRDTPFSFLGKERDSIRALCAEWKVTENTFIQVIWGILLGRYNHSRDVVFGSVVSGRPGNLHGVEEMVGLFINTIPVRIRWEEDTSAQELFRQVQQQYLESADHHYAQLAEIQSASELGRDLFDHIMIFENYPVQEWVRPEKKEKEGTGDISVFSRTTVEQNNYNLTLVVVSNEALSLNISYNANVYDDAQITLLRDHFIELLKQVLETPGRSIDQLSCISPVERQRILVTFNDTGIDFPRGKTLVDLFEDSVHANPDLTAVVSGKHRLTYRQLNEKANRLANYLKKVHSITPDDLVGVRMERSANIIVAILGVLKAGGAYVPIDPEYPQERIDYLLKDSGCKWVLTDDGMKAFEPEEHKYAGDNLPPAAGPEHLAYVIYTSGSTGKPKGVMTDHRAIVNSTMGHQAIIGLRPGGKNLQFHSYSFDVSVYEVFFALTYGAALYIITDEQKKNLAEMENYIRDNDIDYISVPVTYLKLLSFEKLPALKKILTGAEPVAAETVYSLPDRITYYNAYGPTEASVCSSIFTYTHGREIPASNVPIGIPIPNVLLYILDDCLQLTPTGIEGDLHIGGVGLARGYLHNPALTKEKFIADPFREGGRIYRTGDRARWLPDGNIEFIGRKDEQVKIRGYRIEAGEIEVALQGHASIDTAFVMARTNALGENELIAYVVCHEALNRSSIRSHIGKTLPSYMIPAHIVPIDAIPMTAHGKVDRTRLPEPDRTGRPQEGKYLAPRTPTEEKVVKIWEDILCREKIGVLDDYFELGGNSLKAMQVAKKVIEEMGVSLSVKTIFSQNTVEHISAHIDDLLAAPQPSPSFQEQLPSVEEYLASYNQLLYCSPLYTGGSMVILTHEQDRMDQGHLQMALHRLLERHEILRTTFFRAGDRIYQRIQPPGAVKIDLPPLTTISREDWNTVVEQHRALDTDIFDTTLFSVKIYQVKNEGYAILISIHHALIDGYSHGILQEELKALYEAAAGGDHTPLKPLPFQYRDFSQRQHAFLETEEGSRYRAYWMKKLNGFKKAVWPTASAIVRTDNKPLQYLNRVIHGPLYDHMEKFVPANGLTRPTLLMGTLVLLLNKLSGNNDITLLTNVIGRNSKCYGDLDVSGLIGFFSNLLLVRHRVGEEDQALDHLMKVRDGFLEDLNFEAYPLLRLLEDLPGVNSQTFLQDTVFFNYHNYTYLHVRDLSPGEWESNGKGENPMSDPRAFGLTVYEYGNCLRFQLTLNPNRCPVQDIEDFWEMYSELLRQLMNEPFLPTRKIRTNLEKLA